MMFDHDFGEGYNELIKYGDVQRRFLCFPCSILDRVDRGVMKYHYAE